MRIMSSWPKLLVSTLALTQSQMQCPANRPILDEFCQTQGSTNSYFFCSNTEEGHIDVLLKPGLDQIFSGYSIQLLTEKYPIFHSWINWVPQFILNYLPQNEPFKQTFSEVNGKVYLLPNVSYVGSVSDSVDQKIRTLFIELFIDNALNIGSFYDLSTAFRLTGTNRKYLLSILQHSHARDALFFNDPISSALPRNKIHQSLMPYLFNLAVNDNYTEILKELIKHKSFELLPFFPAYDHFTGSYSDSDSIYSAGLERAVRFQYIEILKLLLDHPVAKELSLSQYTSILDLVDDHLNEEVFNLLIYQPQFNEKIETGAERDSNSGKVTTTYETPLGNCLERAARNRNNDRFERLINEFDIQEIHRRQFLYILRDALSLSYSNLINFIKVRLASKEGFGADLVQALIASDNEKIQAHLSNTKEIFALEKEDLFMAISLAAYTLDAKVLTQILANANPSQIFSTDLTHVVALFKKAGNVEMLEFFMQNSDGYGRLLYVPSSPEGD